MQAVEEFTVEKKVKRKSHPICNKTRDAKRARNKNKYKKRKNIPGDSYDANSYRHAVLRATDRVGVPNWTPNQLRHIQATEIRKQFGLDASGAVLGQSKIGTTQIYALRDKVIFPTKSGHSENK